MKNLVRIDLKSLDFIEALKDETIFILHDHRQKRAHHDEQELRCSCVPIRTMSGEALREMVDHIEEYQAIKLIL